MTDEQPTAAGRRRGRGRGAEATARAGALERLKALRQGGRRSGESGRYDIKLENPIYDTVEEEEYDALVARRREEARGFIVDDEGLGYGDEGQEEDWSVAGFASSSDDELTEAQKSIKKKRVEKKEKENGQQVKRSNPSLTAAAAMMGKQRLSAMFTSTAMFKKSKDDKVKESESVVDEVIAEFAPDDADRERRRRTPLVSVPVNNNKSFIPVNSVKSESQMFVNSSNLVQKQDFNMEVGSVQESKSEAVEEKCLIKESEELKLECDVSGDLIKVDAVRVEEEVKEESYKLNAKIGIEEKDPALSASAGWKAVISGNGVAEEVKNGLNSEEQSDFYVDADGSLPFYVLDAHEQLSGANMGTIYLFGKVM